MMEKDPLKPTPDFVAKYGIEFVPVKTKRAARKRAPWAAYFWCVDGGFVAFQSWYDYTEYKIAERDSQR